MSFGEAISICFRKYVTFRGRARRSEYWYFYLFAILVSIPAAVVDSVLSSSTHSAMQPIGGLVGLVLLLPRLSVAVRRLHDVNYSGWFLGGFVIIILALAIVAIAMIGAQGGGRPNMAGPLGIVVAAGGLAVICWGIWLFVLTVMKGTSGPNKYGDDPTTSPVDVFN